MHTARDVHALLDAAERYGEALFQPRAALVTLTRSMGSTFRRPGSRMLVGGGGQVVRGLSGGCPEADIVAHARQVIESGRARLVRYDREYGLDALLELGCGGGLEVMIEPLAGRPSLAFLDDIAGAWRARRSGFAASLLSLGGECLPAGPRRLVWLGSPHSSQFEDAAEIGQIVALGLEALRQSAVAHVETRLNGVEAALLYEAIRPPVQLVIVGVNAVADAVAHLARWLDWSVIRFDPRGGTGPQACAADVALHSGAPADLAACAHFDDSTYALVMNYRLELDVDCAEALLRTPAAYVGMLGSRKRSAAVSERLCRALGEPLLHGRLHTPAGLDIGSEDPEEIALSLVTQIKALAAGKAGGHLHATGEPIHRPHAAELSIEAPPALRKLA